MTVREKAMKYKGKTVGINFRGNKSPVTGVICSVGRHQVYVLQYLYGNQFATFHYRIRDIMNIHPFPSC